MIKFVSQSGQIFSNLPVNTKFTETLILFTKQMPNYLLHKMLTRNLTNQYHVKEIIKQRKK